MRHGLGRRAPIRLGLLAALALACGCAGPRGAVSIDPAAVGTGAAVPVLVASARAPVAGPAVFGPGRAPLSQPISDVVADPSVVEASVDAVGQATTIAVRPLKSRSSHGLVAVRDEDYWTRNIC